jgi:hypothetical protein
MAKMIAKAKPPIHFGLRSGFLILDVSTQLTTGFGLPERELSCRSQDIAITGVLPVNASVALQPLM